MIYLSICTREENKDSDTLQKLTNYSKTIHSMYLAEEIHHSVAYNASSIYEGHKSNIKKFIKGSESLNDEDIIVFVHDDVEILSSPESFCRLLDVTRRPKVGFVGVAGATNFTSNGAWWTARQTGEARGFVFQGKDDETMDPNYFGRPGQVTVLDGCFFAATYKVVKDVGLDQPDYLSSGWDYYDIHMTFLAHYKGYNNYTIPILIRHESSGQMRKGWYNAKDEFMRKWNRDIPCKIPVDKTVGLPKWKN